MGEILHHKSAATFRDGVVLIHACFLSGRVYGSSSVCITQCTQIRIPIVYVRGGDDVLVRKASDRQLDFLIFFFHFLTSS